MIPEPDYSESEGTPSESTEEESEGSSSSGSSAERLRDVVEEDEPEWDHRKRTALTYSIGRLSRGSASSTKTSKSPSRTKKSSFSSPSETVPRSRRSQSKENIVDGDLIQPKKPSNPYQESMERKMLHKELVFKQKYGQSSVNQRSELQKALEKFTEEKVKKDLAASRQSSLEKILEQQARKIEQYEGNASEDVRPAWIKRLQQQHVTKQPDPKVDEFFRVHAKVVGNLFRSHSADEESNHSSDSSSSSSSRSSPSDSEGSAES